MQVILFIFIYLLSNSYMHYMIKTIIIIAIINIHKTS